MLFRAWPVLVVAAASLGCSEVVEVLTANAGGGSTQMSSAGAPAAQPQLGVAISAGQSHTCVAKQGLVYCWGANTLGQLGSSDTSPQLSPVLASASGNIVEVSAGESHTCWLNGDGQVWCFGSNAKGQLGQTPETRSSFVPVAVVLPERAVTIDVNYDHSCAVVESGKLYCWGENTETQLGQGDAPDVDQFAPVLVDGVRAVVAVSCGQGSTFALGADGKVAAWGRNTAGDLGLGTGSAGRVRVPTGISAPVLFRSIDAGQGSACAIEAAAGELYCWGDGLDQHLGTASDATVWAPTLVGGGHRWRAVSLDTFHTCAIDDAQRLWCWGRGIEGQLGLGNHELQPAPVVLTQEWQAVSVGRFHTCAINLQDRVWCAGNNSNGELGIGDTQDRNELTELSLPQ